MTEPVLPHTTSDERDVGWGDDLAREGDERDDEERLRQDRPPHHDRD